MPAIRPPPGSSGSQRRGCAATGPRPRDCQCNPARLPRPAFPAAPVALLRPPCGDHKRSPVPPHTSQTPHFENCLRQDKSWIGGCDELKPFIASQRVRLPSGKGAAHQPGARVAWRAVTHCREAYTAGGQAALLSPEIINADAFVVQLAGAAPGTPSTARGCLGRPGSETVCIATGWLAREPGRPRTVHARRPEDGPLAVTKGPGPPLPAGDRERSSRQAWYWLANQ